MEGLALLCAVLAVVAVWWLTRRPKTDGVARVVRLQAQQLKPFSGYRMIQNPSELNWLISHLSTQEAIGVDIEHCSRSYRGQICLLQLSTSQDFIVDTLALQDHMLSFKPVFEADRPLKVMHGAHNDVKWLFLNYGIKVRSLYDTQEAVKLAGSTDLGLDKLWERFCEFGMDRSEKKAMQKSDWSVRPLSDKQLEYAATDSHYLLYLQQATWRELDGRQRTQLLEICQKTTEKALIPENQRRLEKYRAGMDLDAFETFASLLELRDKEAKARDINPNCLVPTKVLAELANTRPNSLQDYPYSLLNSQAQTILNILRSTTKSATTQRKSALTRQEIKRRRFEQFVEKFSIKKDVYENCQMQAPDGEVLSYCDKKKANWYLERGLATIISESPLILRLKFEPNGRGFSDVDLDNTSYLKEKHNLCVVCGSTGMFQKYHVVPLLYRQFYPHIYKSHRSHDIVLLCPKCHERANTSADRMIRKLSEEYGIPLTVYSELHLSRQQLELACKKAKSVVLGSLPSERKELILAEIQSFFASEPKYSAYMTSKFGEDWWADDSAITYLSCNLNEILSVHGPVNWRKEGMNLHGKQLLTKIPDIRAFSRRWRRYFVETLEPKFLSDAWRAESTLNLKE